MRIVQFVNNLEMGGLERLAVDLAHLQLLDGHQASIYCLTHTGRLAADAQALGIKIRSFEKRPGPRLNTIRHIAKQLREDRPDVLHTHNHLVHHYGVFAGKLAGVPVIVNTRHGVDRKFTVGPEKCEITAEPSDKKADLLFRATLPWVNSVVLISEATRRFYVEHRGIPAKKTHVVLNGAHLERFLKTLAHPGSQRPRVRFGTAARLVREKDHFTLLRAFARVRVEVPGAELQIAGDGPLRESLTKMCADLDLTNCVTFRGALSDTAQFFSELDVFVLSSISEGLPIALLEAMAVGLPVVSTRAGGVEEVAIDGKYGFLADVCDSEGLAQAMIAMARSPNMASMGELGRNMVGEKFRIERMWRDYHQLFLSLGQSSQS